MEKIARARAYLPSHVTIEVDGGVSEYNAGALVAAGANWLVAGSSVFGGRDIEERFAVVAQAAAGGV
jgi:ribulose-phosphate 3-epimerase